MLVIVDVMLLISPTVFPGQKKPLEIKPPAQLAPCSAPAKSIEDLSRPSPRPSQVEPERAKVLQTPSTPPEQERARLPYVQDPLFRVYFQLCAAGASPVVVQQIMKLHGLDPRILGLLFLLLACKFATR